MFFTKSSTTESSIADVDTSPAGAVQATVAGVGNGLRRGVSAARSWAAPRLESAADYCTTTVAPTVSSALRTTARQVSPAEAGSKDRRRGVSALTWSLLGAAVLAAASAAAAAVRRRHRATMAKDSEPFDAAMGGSERGGVKTGVAGESADPVLGAESGAPAVSADSSVNGRVSANGW